MASWAVRWTVDPNPYLWLDALTQKVREDGRIVNVSVVVATAVNGEGKREIIGMDVGTRLTSVSMFSLTRSTTKASSFLALIEGASQSRSTLHEPAVATAIEELT